MNWLEVSVLVEGEAAEAVADVLARYAPGGGVVIESTTIQTEAATPEEVVPDEGRPVGPLSVRCYLPADERLAATRRQLEEGLWHLGRILPIPAPQFRPVAASDWSEAWKAGYQPVRLGRLVILPAWLQPPIAPGAVALRLEPGMAFGTGTHPSTQLCLAALEECLQPGQTVIDLGCGSGILAIAAALLGSGPVLAVDIDPEAAAITGQNAAANGVAGRLQAGQGSVAEILAGNFELGSAQIVFANILARIIVQLAGQGLARLVAPGGLLIAAGILEQQAAEVAAALETHGLRVEGRRQMADWVALLARAPGKMQTEDHP